MANEKRKCYVLLPGFKWNPLLNFPRNEECFCGSGVKHKKCCLSRVEPVVREADVERIVRALKYGGRITIGPLPDQIGNKIELDAE